MVRIQLRKRKSKVLSPSSLRCLSKIPTINITLGCIHSCVYCYSRGYSQFPGKDNVVLFENTSERTEEEIKRKKRKPLAVYFCPSCDPFQPDPAVLKQTYQTMKTLLSHSVGVQFVTKAAVPDMFLKLFEQHNNGVCAQIGLTTTDESLLRVLEPYAVTAQERLISLQRLIDIGVTTSVRVDPLIYGVTDSNDLIYSLSSSVAKVGIKEISFSYLFLRPAIKKSIEENIQNKELARKILSPYSEGQWLSIEAKGSHSLLLPREIREPAYRRIGDITSQHGISAHICGCKNPDITSGSCNLTRLGRVLQNCLFR